MRPCEQTTCGAFIAISISFMSRPLHSLTQLDPREKMFQFRPLRKKEKKKKKKKTSPQTQDAGALAGFSSDKPRKAKGVPKCSLNCRTSIKASKWGRLEGTLAHQTDTPNTHHLYTRLLKKKDQSFCR